MLLLLPTLLLTSATPAADHSSGRARTAADYKLSRSPPNEDQTWTAPSRLKVTQNIVPLKRASSGSKGSSRNVQALRGSERSSRFRRVSRATSGNTTLHSFHGETVFLAGVQVGGQSLSVVIDTGSSDPWVVVPGFGCFSPSDSSAQAPEECAFGPAYATTSNFRPIEGENFNISYADGEYLSGSLGYETFEIAGIVVPNQQFGLVDEAAWYGDGVSSGLIGFAYASLTSAYAGTDPSADVRNQNMPYNPLFVNMYNNEGTPPVFSLALSRGSSDGGVLAIGGIPDIATSTRFVTAAIQPVGVNATSGKFLYEYYTIAVTGYAVSNSRSTQFNPFDNDNPLKTSLLARGSQTIIDSGTSLCYVPDNVADSVAAAFDPPATWDASTDTYKVDCDAVAPVFGVAISGKTFFVSSEDLVIQVDTDWCVSGVQPDLGGFDILGETWMKNVVAVFDVGAAAMQFAARQLYDGAE